MAYYLNFVLYTLTKQVGTFKSKCKEQLETKKIYYEYNIDQLIFILVGKNQFHNLGHNKITD